MLRSGDGARSSPRSRLVARHRLGLVLGVAMAAGNVLGYASVILVSAELGPADFGAVAALTSLGVITAIPAGALQVMIARRASSGEDSSGSYALGAVVGAALWLVLVALSPLLMASFDLASVWPVFWLGLTLVPMTVVGVQQGLLLGSQRLGRLAVLFLFAGVSRLLATVWCVVVQPTVTGAFLAWAVAAVAGLVVGHVLAHGLVPRHARLRTLGPLATALARSSLTLLSLIVFTSIDTILARHYLSAYDSGIYGIASMFAKVIFWGTQFIAMIVVPRLAHQRARALVLKAYGAITLLALPVILVVAIDPGFWLSAVGLDAYADAGTLLIGFAVLGLLWSLTQVSVFIEMGVGHGRTTLVVLSGLALHVVLVVGWLHSSPLQVWLATSIAAVAVTVTSSLMLLLAPRARRGARVGSGDAA